jgi:putative transposase
LNNHIDFIHFNPVKHELVKEAVDWPWSSFQRFMKSGYFPANWGKGYKPFEMEVNQENKVLVRSLLNASYPLG